VRLVVALGGNALLERGEIPDANVQEAHVAAAVAALAPLAEHELLVTHGNGPQVGVLALESAADRLLTHAYPLGALGAETQGLIGYWLLRELRNALPGREVAAVVTQTLVRADDPAFACPTKFVGPTYEEDDARRLAAEQDWTVAPDGRWWRRVVPSPTPLGILELEVIRRLLAAGVVVIGAGGGGVPVVVDADGRLSGVEAVVDKDLTAALLAEALGADWLLVLTDVPGVEAGHDTPSAELIRRTTPEALRRLVFPAGSMGPKVEAVCRFVERTGRRAAIGALGEAPAVLAGASGTLVEPARTG
jgi:carbamate kinase